MTVFPDHPSRLWKTPAVRHLAWLCGAASLTDSSLRIDLGPYLPDDIATRLAHLDDHPEPLLTRIADNPRPRLGVYFERLYHFLLADILGWSILLENAQVTREGRTVGELDFVVHNRHDDRIEHHEIAVKFYLGVSGSLSKTIYGEKAGDSTEKRADKSADATLWYGPNAQDRLDIKTSRLITHQCRLTELPETRQLLARHGIGLPCPRLFMPGYLFYPVAERLARPATTPEVHGKGAWQRAEHLSDDDVSDWICLQKPHWLGRFQSTTAPDPDKSAATLNAIQQGAPPRLFAQMTPRAAGGWEELRRIFVVPDHWPGVQR
ncbi:DUF1853 family protein [Marinobacter fonticola]|uniref:DUF1853 family protein n=1 Tax=Marinobacter fonticola TaxID=2603215 RepID=UPI0011E73FED|nr:DUF1853 family protein [Marinobacter fonticola]